MRWNFANFSILEQGNPYHHSTYRFPPLHPISAPDCAPLRINGWKQVYRMRSQLSESRDYYRRFAQSAGLGSEKGSLLELIFAWLRKGSTFGLHFRTQGGSFVIFGLFFDHWEHFGSAGSPLFDHKTVRATKGAPRDIPPKIQSLFGIHLGICFWVFFCIAGAMFLSIVFGWVLELIFDGFWLHVVIFFVFV